MQENNFKVSDETAEEAAVVCTVENNAVRVHERRLMLEPDNNCVFRGEKVFFICRC